MNGIHELEQAKWIEATHPEYELFLDEEKQCGWSNDYTEIFMYFSEISGQPMIRMVNVEMINETYFICEIPNTEEKFRNLLNAAGFII